MTHDFDGMIWPLSVGYYLFARQLVAVCDCEIAMEKTERKAVSIVTVPPHWKNRDSLNNAAIAKASVSRCKHLIIQNVTKLEAPVPPKLGRERPNLPGK